MENNSLLKTALYNLQKTAGRLGLDDDMFARLSEPKEKIEITASPTLSGGKLHFRAFVVQHNDAIGPAKGGIRMSPSVTMEDIIGLSMEMTWKTSLIGVPFGGGKSGICVDPTGLSANDKEVVIRAFTRAILRHMGPEIYVPAPDMGTNETDMGHIRDCITYSAGTSITSGCYVTGKPVVLGGIVGRREATGKGLVYATLAACEKLGIDIKKARVAVQGFGNVGSYAAIAIAEAGAKVVAVADVTGGVYNEDGLDVQKLIAHFRSTGSLKDFAASKPTTSKGVLEVPCDILLPAATQSQITLQNADKIQAKIIAEGANSPTTPEADEILKDRGIFVIPDILCNAGGVFVSYLEYTQETQREQMTLEQVDQRLRERMRTRFNDISAYAADKMLTMREAAMDLAVARVVEAIMARGFLP
jgi:glutamate dehydrogenase/leucine dehydrogenase